MRKHALPDDTIGGVIEVKANTVARMANVEIGYKVRTLEFHAWRMQRARFTSSSANADIAPRSVGVVRVGGVHCAKQCCRFDPDRRILIARHVKD